MTTLTTDQPVNRLTSRPRRKFAAVPRGPHRQPADVQALVARIQPSGYFGQSDTWAFIVTVLRSSPEFGDTLDWLATGTGGDCLSDLLIELNEGDDNTSSLSAGEQIASIQASLSLQIKELAEILHVKRPTIYSWLNDESEPFPNNRERLQQVYQIAQAWNARCHLPAERLIRAPDKDGVSAVDLLKDQVIDEAAVVDRFDGLATERMKLKAEADAKRPPVAEIAQHHGFELSSESAQQAAVDVFTGKRFSPD